MNGRSCLNSVSCHRVTTRKWPPAKCHSSAQRSNLQQHVLCAYHSKSGTSTLHPPLLRLCNSAHQTAVQVLLLTKPFIANCAVNLTLILLKARFLLSKISTLTRFVQNHSYDIIQISKLWLTGYTPTNQILPLGCKSFLVHGINRRGCNCLDYLKGEFSVFPPASSDRHFLYALWLYIRMHNSSAHLKCVYRIPISNDFEILQLINAFEYGAPIHGGAKLMALDFNASEVCWSTSTAALQLLNFVRETHVGERTQHALTPPEEIVSLTSCLLIVSLKLPLPSSITFRVATTIRCPAFFNFVPESKHLQPPPSP